MGDQERPAGDGRHRCNHRRPAAGVPGGDGGAGPRDELVPAGGGAPAQGRRRVPDALRVDLDAGERLRRGADAVLAIRGRSVDQQQDGVHGVVRQRGAKRGPQAGRGGGGDTRQVMGRGRGQELRGSAAEWKDKAVLAARPGGSAWVNMEMVVNEVLAHWCVAVNFTSRKSGLDLSFFPEFAYN